MKAVSRLIYSSISIGLILVLILSFAQLSISAEDNKTAEKKEAPSDLNITSDKMVAQKDQSMVEFTGDVKAVRAGSVLLADCVKVFFHTSETKKQGQSNIKRILAQGHVEYTEGENRAFSDQADYDTAKEVLILTGNEAKLLTGKSWITGKKITLYRANERVVVESAEDSRVNAFFDAQDQDKGQPQPAVTPENLK